MREAGVGGGRRVESRPLPPLPCEVEATADPPSSPVRERVSGAGEEGEEGSVGREGWGDGEGESGSRGEKSGLSSSSSVRERGRGGGGRGGRGGGEGCVCESYIQSREDTVCRHLINSIYHLYVCCSDPCASRLQDVPSARSCCLWSRRARRGDGAGASPCGPMGPDPAISLSAAMIASCSTF